MTRYPHSDPVLNAWAIRSARALPVEQRDAAIDEIAQRVADRIQIARAAAPDASHVEVMRALGGFSQIIRDELGPVPDAQANGIGMPTSDAFFRHQVLAGLSERIRNRAVDLLRAQDGATL